MSLVTPARPAILVNGMSGAGKTTLARELSYRLGLPLFAKDTIKETSPTPCRASTPARARVRARHQTRHPILGKLMTGAEWALLSALLPLSTPRGRASSQR